MKVAVTEVEAASVTTQDPVPEQPPPLQPLKSESLLALALNVTIVPVLKEALQVAPHEMPAGAEVTVPEPVPAFTTASVLGFKVKFAVTVDAAVRVTVQVPVPVQAPLQPLKVELASCVAVRVTVVPWT